MAFVTIILCILPVSIRAQVNSKFYIYLCLGQSNMEGYARISTANINFVDERFCVLNTADSSERSLGQWYTAYPPIVRPGAGIGILDFFGPSMIEQLPNDVRVGVVPVAFGAGAPISCFDKDTAPLSNNTTVNTYFGGNAYTRLIEMALVAMKDGIVKGILFHQGEANCGEEDWPDKVKKIYNDILSDLKLEPSMVPLIAGELVNEDMGGACSVHNAIINKLPEIIPTAHVISSSGCPCLEDNTHFSVDGYKEMGNRFASEALRLLGKTTSIRAIEDKNCKDRTIYNLQGQKLEGHLKKQIYIFDGKLVLKSR